MGDENPHEICTWDDDSDCSDCALDGRLFCKWEAKRLPGFAALILPFVVTTGFGMILTGSLTGNWVPQAVYAVFILLFFTVVETRLLCRHCPYYARSGRTIRCHANYGLPKVWQYQPEPMNRKEKTCLIICLIFVGLYPFLTEAYGVWFLYSNYGSHGLIPLLGLTGIAITNVATAMSFLYLLIQFYCPHCVNFSCPLNKVPEGFVQEYLDKNPVMKNAWAGQ